MTAATLTGAARGRGAPASALTAVALAGVSIVIGLLAGALETSGHTASVFALGAVALVVVLWKQPALSPIVVLVAALTIEQFPFGSPTPGATSTGVTPSDLTDRIPLFHGIAGGIHISPADLLLLALIVIWLLKRGTGATAKITRSPVTYSIGALLAAVGIGIIVGQAHHGSLRTAFTEIRPFFYLAVGYLVASVFATRMTIIRAAFWALVLGSGLKAMQAIYSFHSVRGQQPRPDFVVGHEEALFFALFVLLTLSLWLFEVRGRLRTVATLLLPIVVVADLVNSRRAAWLILGGALIVLTVVGMVAVPARRRFLMRMIAVLVLFSVVYFPVYWNHSGALAGPARAVHSAVAPNPRDLSSDLYRVQEDANLKYNIRQGGLIGKGFGVPIDYALPITDISDIDPLIAYVPHNGVFYILMRMGLLGGIAFWSLLGAGIIGGCRLARTRDREVALFGALLACALVGYALEGYNDQGFFMYRVAFVMGTLLGLGEAARRLAATRIEPVAKFEPIVPVVSAIPRRPAAAAASVSIPLTPPIEPAPALFDPKVLAANAEPSTERLAQIAALVLLPLAIGFMIWLVFVGKKESTATPSSPVRAGSVAKAPERPARVAAARPPAPKPVRLVLTSVRNDSWVEVRRDSPSGAVVYAGKILSGQEVKASARRLWARFGSASNLEITANGKRVALQGTVDVVFTPSGASAQPRVR